MELGLFQKQTTKLIMTTELRQAIAILQYSAVELTDFLKEEALENPLIELKENKNWQEDGFRSTTYSREYSPSQSDEEQDSPIDYVHVKEENIQSVLLEQLRDLSFPESERKILAFLIENINEAGYLVISLEEAARFLGKSEEDVYKAFKYFQLFEPIGIGARSLQECLLWQLEELEERSFLTEKIVENDLELLAEKKWNDIAAKYNVSLKEVQASADLVLSLNPKPGAALGEGKPRYLFPDITVEKVEGEYLVTLNDYMLPTIHLNRQYQYMLSQAGKTEAEQYMNEKYSRVMWLIRSIEQRRMTLLRLSEAIVKHQKEFLEKGVLHLKPMTLKEIADEIDVHESTVSRAVKHKVIQTPKGIYELKDFFTSKVESADGEGASSRAVKHVMQTLIDGEDKYKPLSDQKIVDLLKGEGIKISRRTVAKYREEMNIPSSSKRKRFQ
ncbi:RNA polymerase sigma-54 factor [Pueribacillus theae]|uniref:RNA polymerase sigma-54 factor n=1 Tax=Pueribacillus theae TaxID=2171751 RepID=A0A2U1K5P7_9BACI|nr:RNA polymerase factor sigma-54 [Pueribacillus theae]PWA12575.1 RNA polymerase sigma-54 factor [Pueribacillus theae]